MPCGLSPRGANRLDATSRRPPPSSRLPTTGPHATDARAFPSDRRGVSAAVREPSRAPTASQCDGASATLDCSRSSSSRSGGRGWPGERRHRDTDGAWFSSRRSWLHSGHRSTSNYGQRRARSAAKSARQRPRPEPSPPRRAAKDSTDQKVGGSSPSERAKQGYHRPAVLPVSRHVHIILCPLGPVCVAPHVATPIPSSQSALANSSAPDDCMSPSTWAYTSAVVECREWRSVR